MKTRSGKLWPLRLQERAASIAWALFPPPSLQWLLTMRLGEGVVTVLLVWRLVHDELVFFVSCCFRVLGAGMSQPLPLATFMTSAMTNATAAPASNGASIISIGDSAVYIWNAEVMTPTWFVQVPGGSAPTCAAMATNLSPTLEELVIGAEDGSVWTCQVEETPVVRKVGYLGP